MKKVRNMKKTIILLMISLLITTMVSSVNASCYINEPIEINKNYTVPDYIQIGDLLFMDCKNTPAWSFWARPGEHNDHAVIYAGDNKFIEAHTPVRYITFEELNDRFKNFAYAYVKTATKQQKNDAVNWTKDRLGDIYQWFNRPPFFGLKIANPNIRHPTAKKWYCTELVWAAYYNQGIDIDRNGWNFPRWVTCNDILWDDDIVLYNNFR